MNALAITPLLFRQFFLIKHLFMAPFIEKEGNFGFANSSFLYRHFSSSFFYSFLRSTSAQGPLSNLNNDIIVLASHPFASRFILPSFFIHFYSSSHLCPNGLRTERQICESKTRLSFSQTKP